MAWEVQTGQQEYGQLMQQGRLVPQSPYYEQLEPVGQRIATTVGTQYFAPFHFILTNQQAPNAFAVPGGNVYVTTGLMQFVHNQDELAGVLCHEVSHDVHHDVYNDNRKSQGLQMGAGILGALLGMGGGIGGAMGQMAVGVGAVAQSKTYSRQAETNADRAGAYTCANAGFNPWGMVWLFRRMAQQPASHGGNSPEWLEDHPKDGHRVADLTTLFNSDPATFGKYRDDEMTATPLAKIETYPQQQPGYGYPQQQPGGYPYPQQQPGGYPYPQQLPGGYPYPQQQPPQPQRPPQPPPPNVPQGEPGNNYPTPPPGAPPQPPN